MTTPMTTEHFDKCRDVDFMNGAVLDEIRAALEHREALIDAVAKMRREHKRYFQQYFRPASYRERRDSLIESKRLECIVDELIDGLFGCEIDDMGKDR